MANFPIIIRHNSTLCASYFAKVNMEICVCNKTVIAVKVI